LTFQRFDWMNNLCDVVQEWPKALAMDSRAWEQSFKFPKLGSDDLVILHCMDCLLFCFSLHKLIMLSQDFITMMGGHVQSSPLADKSAVSHRLGFKVNYDLLGVNASVISKDDYSGIGMGLAGDY